MGRGQRHSKNAGGMGSEAFTYAERKALGFGTMHERIGKVGVLFFGVCARSLRPPQQPACFCERPLSATAS